MRTLYLKREGMGKEEEDVSSYWMTLREIYDIRNLKRKH